MPVIRRLFAYVGSCVVAAAFVPAVGAQDLKSCTTLEDAAERLACYDRVAGRTASRTAAPAPGPPSVPASAEVPVTAAAAAAASTATATAEQDFGLTPAAKKALEPAAAGDAKPEAIEGTIAAIARDGQDRFVVTLDNGQVWAQNEAKSGVYPRPGESVTISRAAMGGYVLRSERFGSIRVRRLK